MLEAGFASGVAAVEWNGLFWLAGDNTGMEKMMGRRLQRRNVPVGRYASYTSPQYEPALLEQHL